jgi:hypothetical protein
MIIKYTTNLPNQTTATTAKFLIPRTPWVQTTGLM